MKAILKCYYGYKNFGDELLFFWVLEYLFSHLAISHIAVESWNKARLDERIKRNSAYLPVWKKVSTYSKSKFSFSFSPALKIFWWWEVLTDERPFIQDGRGYFFKYFWDIMFGNFVLLGGIGKPRFFRSRLLYKLMLPRAKQIIVREKDSFKIAKKYSKKVTLHRDFAYDLIEKYQETHKETISLPNLLINLHPKINKPESYRKIDHFIKKNSNKELRYVWMSPQDLPMYDKLLEIYPEMKLRNWTSRTLDETLDFFQSASCGIWARLHFLLTLKAFNVPHEAIVYEEKIMKLIVNEKK